MPPRPAVTTTAPAQVPPKCWRADRGERLVRALQDALRADVDPRAGRHLAVHRQALRAPARGTPPRSPTRRRGWQLAISTRGAHSCVRKTPTGLPDCTSSVSSSPSSPQLRDDGVEGRPSRAPPCRCRRRRRGRPGRSATSGSRLFMSIRSAASVSHDGAVRVVPRGARTGRAPSIWSLVFSRTNSVSRAVR